MEADNSIPPSDKIICHWKSEFLKFNYRNLSYKILEQTCFNHVNPEKVLEVEKNALLSRKI